MNYRGMILTISPTGEGGHRNEFICTANYANHVEIVPTVPGTEGLAFPPISLSGPGLVGVIYDWRSDPALIERVKARCASVVRNLEGDNPVFAAIFTRGVLGSTLRNAKQNLARLESLDGDQPVAASRPAPIQDRHAALDRVFNQLFAGDYEVIGKLQDSIFIVPKTKEIPMIGVHPDLTGKLAFIEIPLGCDEDGESGEYVIVKQSPDSLYGVKTTCCMAGLEVVRIPFESGEQKIAILDVYEDDDFIEDFIERLDDMDTEDYEPIECDLAETASRQLSRMLEKKLTDRAKLDDPLDRLFKATDRLFSTLGTMSGRMSSVNPSFQAEDRIHRTGCGHARNECCGCGV